MTKLPDSDEMVERIYDTVNRQQGEARRAEVARAALLAAQYRAAQLAKKETKPNDRTPDRA